MQARVGISPLRSCKILYQRFNCQGCFPDHTFYVPKMGGEKDRANSMNKEKKRKIVIPVWRPISTQSDAPGSGTASSSGSNSASYDNQSTTFVEKQSTVSCEMENLSERNEHTSVSGAYQQVEVVEESIYGCSSNHNADLASQVEKISVSVEVDASLIRFIKGKGGCTQKQIEEETGVKILFPSSKEDNYIVIEGNNDESVTKASEKIAKVLEEVVKSPSLDYSHFISLPLAIHTELVGKLQDFQNAILGCSDSGQEGNLESNSNEDTSEDSNDEGKSISIKLEVENKKEHVRVKIDATNANSDASKNPSSILSELGIDKSIFIKPKTFHLTVLMLKLWNKDRVAAAAEVLQKISSEVNDALDNRPVLIRLKGLKCMRGSPAKARVLYAPVEEIGGEGRLLRACQVIIKAYVEAGLVLEKDAQQALKLHATLMNARHRKGKKRMKRHDFFDARGIFLRYGSENWGDYLIQEAHLSQRFIFDESGYYHCCASISFPESMQVK